MIADGQVAELRGGDGCHKGREWMPVPQGNRSEQSRIGQKRRGGGGLPSGGLGLDRVHDAWFRFGDNVML